MSRTPRLLLAVAGTGLALIWSGCGDGTPQHRSTSHRAVATPTPAQPTPAAPTASPVPPARGKVPPASTAPPPAGIPHHSQGLQVSGSFQGKVGNAEVKACGASRGRWYLQLSGMAVGTASGSLSLSVLQYSGPNTYRPQGSLMLIVSQQASFLSVTDGSVTVHEPRSGSMDLTFADARSTTRVSGTWTCPAG